MQSNRKYSVGLMAIPRANHTTDSLTIFTLVQQLIFTHITNKMNMHLALHLLVATMNIAVVVSCPFGPNRDTAAAPNDAVHQQTAGALRRRGRT